MTESEKTEWEVSSSMSVTATSFLFHNHVFTTDTNKLYIYNGTTLEISAHLINKNNGKE